MKIITSRENPLFKKLRGLAQDTREVRKQGMTLLDGPHLVATYRHKVGLPEYLVVSEAGVESVEVQGLLDSHDPQQTICFKDSLFREISPSESPVGILSVISIPVVDGNPEPRGDCILLDAMQDSGNVGTIIRSALAFGIENIYLGNGCAGAWTPKVLRAGQGAHFGLNIHERVDLAAFLAAYKGKRLATVVDADVSLYSLPLVDPVALVIGNEGQGVSPSLLAMCDCRVTIPMSNECESLNAAVAASICMSEMARQKATHGFGRQD